MTPQKYPQNLHTPKIFVFLKTPQNIEMQNLEPKNVTRAYVYMKISEDPPPLLGCDHPLCLKHDFLMIDEHKDFIPFLCVYMGT